MLITITFLLKNEKLKWKPWRLAFGVNVRNYNLDMHEVDYKPSKEKLMTTSFQALFDLLISSITTLICMLRVTLFRIYTWPLVLLSAMFVINASRDDPALSIEWTSTSTLLVYFLSLSPLKKIQSTTHKTNEHNNTMRIHLL